MSHRQHTIDWSQATKLRLNSYIFALVWPWMKGPQFGRSKTTRLFGSEAHPIWTVAFDIYVFPQESMPRAVQISYRKMVKVTFAPNCLAPSRPVP